MRTREIVHAIIDTLSEEQLQALLILLHNPSAQQKQTNSVRGIFSDYADPARIPLEEGAWERTVADTN